MTMACAHEHLTSLNELQSMCAQCKTVITIGTGICAKCHKALDDHPMAQACPS